jgi:1-deoxy-D-xylulose-5-phosphate reductoisomerase
MKSLAILGCTGSIGRQTLSVIESLPNEFRVSALAAGNNLDTLLLQIISHHPELVSVATPELADELVRRLRQQNLTPLPAIHHGREGLLATATHPGVDVVVSAAVGVVGLEATYQAVTLGRTIALSNKEVLVAAGELVMAAAAKAGRELLPVDSEHNAVHQCLRASRRNVFERQIISSYAKESAASGKPHAHQGVTARSFGSELPSKTAASATVDGLYPEVRRIVLTASGGPFRKTPIRELANVTVEQALAHPNWKMGNRITVDSASMMNKGFEVIEARWLFGMRPDQIDVIIHPQSVIHSFVEFVDGAVLAQIAPPDMRMPIQYALTYPARLPSEQVQLDWCALRRLDFEKASARRFPCLRLAREAMKKGGALPAALNAADEVAVAAFLENRLPFKGIPEIIERVLARTSLTKLHSIDDVLHVDNQARRQAFEAIRAMASHANSA